MRITNFRATKLKKSLQIRLTLVLLLTGLVAGVHSIAVAQGTSGAHNLPDTVINRFGEPPAVPEGEFDEEVQKAIDVVFKDSLENGSWGRDQSLALATLADSKDPRIAWLLTDLMRFITQQDLVVTLVEAAEELLNIQTEAGDYWGATTDHLMAWNIPEPPNYLQYKKAVFTTLVPGWDKIFEEGDIDWRHVSWGGVLIDDRPYDTTDELCNCIPAADNPEVISAKEAKWLKDDDVVFGIGVNGEFRAYPRQIMEVREMVNDTVGGRTLGIPYCTLCGAAQAYFTDELPEGIERPVLRTSGLLIRSNKVMYDITTHSVFNTFTGKAVTGPLAEKNLKLEQTTVVTTTWGEWKKAYPESTVLIEALALGRNFDFRNNRDADGPIFPVGDVDPRLPVHEDIVGVVTPEGQAVAFDQRTAFLKLSKGEAVEYGDIRLELDGGGIKAVTKSGDALGSHQAFWFAWSQFHPDTVLWPVKG